MVDDVSNHRFLALRVRVGGSPRTRNSYYVNIQTDGPITSDLWQHRLFFNRDDGGWEDIFVCAVSSSSQQCSHINIFQIPFDNFVLTNTGEIQNDQMSMYRERLRTVGVSILGGNSGVEGTYELGVDCIRAVNEEDVTTEPSTSLHFCTWGLSSSTHRVGAFARDTVAAATGMTNPVPPVISTVYTISLFLGFVYDGSSCSHEEHIAKPGMYHLAYLDYLQPYEIQDGVLGRRLPPQLCTRRDAAVCYTRKTIFS